MLVDLADSGSIPALAATLQFAAARQRLIASNVANLSTPDYRQLDVSPGEFRARLDEAIQNRRRETGGAHGDLRFRASRSFGMTDRGQLQLNPHPISRGILFHDRNNRDLERLMQDQAENAATFRVAGDLLRTRVDLLRSAISERV